MTKSFNSPALPLVTAVVIVGAGATVLGPSSLLGVSLLFAGVAFVAHRRMRPSDAMASLFFLLVLIPELAAAPPVIPVGGVQIFVPHVLAIGLLPFVDWSDLRPWARRVLLGFGLLVVWMGLWGLFRGAPLNAVLQDIRGPLTFFGGVLSAMVLVSHRGVEGLLRLVPPILGVSVLLILTQLVTGFELLGGRVRDATVFNGVGQNARAIDATRFIVSSEDLAVASLLVVGWWLSQPRNRRPQSQILVFVAIMGAAIVVLSLSRQLLVGLAVGTLAWVFVRGGAARMTRIFIASVPFLVVGALVVSLLTAVGAGIGSEGLIGRQLGGFSERVLGGLTSEGVSEDAGTAWRQRENQFAIELIRAEPLGTGFGRPYRPEFAIEAFGDPTFFRRWVHNVYLWYGTKGGVLGLFAVGLVTVGPLFAAIRRSRRAESGRDPVAEVAVPILFAFGVMSLVDPVIINASSGVVTAAVLVLLGLRKAPSFRDAQPVARFALPQSTGLGSKSLTPESVA